MFGIAGRDKVVWRKGEKVSKREEGGKKRFKKGVDMRLEDVIL